MSSAAGGSESTTRVASAVTYYKSRRESPPVMYVQREDAWEGYGRDGALWEKGEGRLSFHTLAACQEIAEAEAERLVPARTRKSSLSKGSDLRAARDVARFVPSELRFRVRQFVMFVLWTLLVGSVAVGIVAAEMAAFGHGELLGWGARVWVGPVFVIVFLLGMLLFYGPIGVSRPLRMHLRDDCLITVDETQVTGPEVQPTSWCWRQMTIPLTQLDRLRSGRRSLVDRLTGRQYLWSKEGGKIYFPRSTFSSADVHELFRRLEIGD